MIEEGMTEEESKAFAAQKMAQGGKFDRALVTRLAMRFAATPERREFLSSHVLGKPLPASVIEKASKLELGQSWLEEHERDRGTASIIKILLVSFLKQNAVQARLLGHEGRRRLLWQAEFDFADDVESLETAAGKRKAPLAPKYPPPIRTGSEFQSSGLTFAGSVPDSIFEPVRKALAKKKIQAQFVEARDASGARLTDIYVPFEDGVRVAEIVNSIASPSPRQSNPFLSYHGRRGPIDRMTDRVHVERLGPDSDLNVEVWDNKRKMMEFQAEEVALSDVGRKRNPFFVGTSREGMAEVFYSEEPMIRDIPEMVLGRYVGVEATPFRTQRAAEEFATREKFMPHQVVGPRTRPRMLAHSRQQFRPTHFWPERGSEEDFLERRHNPSRRGLQDAIPREVEDDPEFQRELDAYYKRHGKMPVEVQRVKVPDGYPRYMSAWGKAPDVKYDSSARSSNKGKRIHHFGEGGKEKPWLVSSESRGPKFLAYVGGDFRADGDWIID